MESIRLGSAEVGRDPPPGLGECFLKRCLPHGQHDPPALRLRESPGPWLPAESGAELPGRQGHGAGQQGAWRWTDRRWSRLAHPGAPRLQQATAQGTPPQVAVEAMQIQGLQKLLRLPKSS